MKIEIHASGGPDMVIPLPNAVLFNPTLLNWGLKFTKRNGNPVPELPPETVNQVCNAIKNYTKMHGSWELVHVESAGGDTVIITV